MRAMQMGEEADSLYILLEGNVSVEASFVEIPPAQRAVDFPVNVSSLLLAGVWQALQCTQHARYQHGCTGWLACKSCMCSTACTCPSVDCSADHNEQKVGFVLLTCLGMHSATHAAAAGHKTVAIQHCMARAAQENSSSGPAASSVPRTSSRASPGDSGCWRPPAAAARCACSAPSSRPSPRPCPRCARVQPSASHHGIAATMHATM